MTVSELIDALSKVPLDSPVVIPGYEGGYDNPEVKTGTIVLDTNWDGQSKILWYNGRHDKFYPDLEIGTVQPVNCVIVGRGV